MIRGRIYPAHPYERWRHAAHNFASVRIYGRDEQRSELRPHWQQVRELMLQEAEVTAVSWQVRLAVLKDAKLDVSALSEPLI